MELKITCVDLRATAREILDAVYRDWTNNYLTVECFADHNDLTTDQAQRLIALAREVHNSPHPES